MEELTQELEAFGAGLGGPIAIVVRVVMRLGKPRLLVACTTAPADALERALLPWGSEPFVCEVGDLVTLRAALTRAMYGLDAQRAEEAWRALQGSKA